MSWKPRIDRRGGPLYRAVAEAIAADVQVGRLRAGDRLPPQRELADLLGLTVTTITRAYAEAGRRGLVRGEVGRGTFVTPPAFAPLAEGSRDVIDLATNALLPHAHAGELTASLAALVARTDPERLFNYQPHGGRLEHRAAAAAFLARHDVPAEADQTLLTAGAQHAMTVALGTLTSPGDTVLCEAVTYTGMRSLAHHLHVRLVGVPMDGEGLLPDALEDASLESGGRVLYCMPSLQNPTGRVMSRRRRQEIARLATRLGLHVVEDDVYGFLVPGQIPLAALVPERTFYLTGFSKCLVPGLRLGILRTPPPWVERVTGAVFATTVTAAPLAAAAAAEWLQNGVVDRITAWKREEVEARQALARTTLGRALSGAPESQHLWLQLPRRWTADDFARAARQHGVVVTPAREFAVARHDAPNAARLCLGPPADRPTLQRGLSTLREILRGAPQPFDTSV
ncbi:MAG: aminotransferase-like domain-containing protein [Acidobacteriota bacterium]